MWEALWQGFTIISLIKSLEIASDIQMIVIFTSDWKTTAQEKMGRRGITRFHPASDFKPLRKISLLPNDTQNQQDKVSLP